MSCLFCRIASGEIPSSKVGENEGAFAFLDIQPLARGHVLVIPKQHAERFADMPRESARAVMDLAQDVVGRLGKRLGAHGVTIAANDGRAAGQEVMHVHVHLVPRAEADGHGPIHALFKTRAELKAGELQEIAEKLAPR
ncbi:MAG TPA: HIT family protein [Candidatus Thermoplasmatota archaeon]|nr:HIT family protein [Candidatus Thermoplasmatota archaeon]